MMEAFKRKLDDHLSDLHWFGFLHWAGSWTRWPYSSNSVIVWFHASALTASSDRAQCVTIYAEAFQTSTVPTLKIPCGLGQGTWRITCHLFSCNQDQHQRYSFNIPLSSEVIPFFITLAVVMDHKGASDLIRPSRYVSFSSSNLSSFPLKSVSLAKQGFEPRSCES